MTKMVALRVTVPADDAVQVGEVQAMLRRMLRGAGTDTAIAIASERPDGALPFEEERAVFWGAADVKQGAMPGARGGKAS